MLENRLSLSKRLKIEDKVDTLLSSLNLPHPRIEPELADVETEYDTVIDILKKQFNNRISLDENKYNFKFKSQSNMWIQGIQIKNYFTLPGIIFYSGSKMSIQSDLFLKHGFTHELLHLKQLTASKKIIEFYRTPLIKNNKLIFTTILEGFAEYFSYKINQEYFHKKRKHLQLASDINTMMIYKNLFNIQEQKIIKGELKTLNHKNKGNKIDPYFSGYVLYSQIIRAINNDLIDKKVLTKLITDPIRKDINYNSTEEIIKAIKEDNLFMVNKEELYSPYKFIEKNKK